MRAASFARASASCSRSCSSSPPGVAGGLGYALDGIPEVAKHPGPRTAVLAELRTVLASAAVEDEDRAAANADIACVEAQLASPRPNEAVVREGLRSLRSVAENLVASGAFQGLLELVQRLPL